MGWENYMIKNTYLEYFEKTQNYFNDFRNVLGELVKHPTIAFREPEAIDNCANSLREFFREYGYSSTIYPTAPKGSPVVFAEKNIGAEKTMMFYFHYDVQPEDPINLWKSSPWELVERGNRLYARGITDDKGPIVLSLLAVKLLEDNEKLAVNVKFVVEGEEEAGSQNLNLFTEKHPELLKADGCIWEGAMLTPNIDSNITFNTPVNIYCGLKGNAYYDITTADVPFFPRTDVHSGTAAAVPNAAWRLVWALASLKDENENILIEGFNELIKPPTEDDLKALQERDDNFAQSIKDDFNLKNTLLKRKGEELLVELTLKPTLTICGLDSGYQEEGSKTIVPAKASAKLDFRLVPNLTMKKVDKLLRKHMKKHGFDDIKLDLLAGYDPAKTPVNEPFIQQIVKISNEITSLKSVLSPMHGGSGPAYLFAKYTPLCYVRNYVEELNVHAPNENFPTRLVNASIAFNALIVDKMASTV